MKRYLSVWIVAGLLCGGAGRYFYGRANDDPPPSRPSLTELRNQVRTGSASAWRALSATRITISELIAICGFIEGIPAEDLAKLPGRPEGGAITDPAVAAVLAERMALLAGPLRIRMLTALERSNNEVVLMAWAHLFPREACEDFAQLPVLNRMAVVRRDFVRDAFEKLTRMDPSMAAQLALGFKPPGRAIPMIAVAAVLAETGDKEGALRLLKQFTAGERNDVKFVDIPGFDRYPARDLVEHMKDLPPKAKRRIIERWATESPLETFSWLKSSRPDKAGVQAFLTGLGQLADPAKAREIASAVLESKEALPAGIRNRVSSALTLAAVRNNPEQSAEFLSQVTESESKDRLISQAAGILLNQSDEFVEQALLAKSDDSGLLQSVQEALINRQPKRAISLMPRLPPQIAAKMKQELIETYGDKVTDLLR